MLWKLWSTLMIKQRYLNFQKDLQDGMTLAEALEKHNLTLRQAFNTLHFSQPPKPITYPRDYNRTVDYYIFKRKRTYSIRKQINDKQCTFGSYSTLEDAQKVRDYLIAHHWKTPVDEACRILKVKRRRGRR